MVAIAIGSQARLDATALARGPLRVGRETHCAIVLDERASREHAEIGRRRDRWYVRDLDSRNGTFVDGARVSGEVEVEDGALVRAGRSLLLVRDDIRGYEGREHDDRVIDGMIVGPTMAAALRQVAQAAGLGRVMILGETGAGKELAAQRFHAATAHPRGPLVAVNCAAIPEGVADAMLFGSRKGAFSGAVADRVGLVEAASGGTLFLDELGELDLQIQGKLLRVLETREVLPVGETKPRPVEFTLCAATHRDLRGDVTAGRFRQDLYYRIARPAVVLPPLRRRREDIPALVLSAVSGVDASLEAHVLLLEACCLRPWPGNVRELLAEVGRAALAAVERDAGVVRLEDLAAEAGLALEAVDGPRADAPARNVSREEIVAALAEANGNTSAAARKLGLHRTQLYRLMRRHELG